MIYKNKAYYFSSIMPNHFILLLILLLIFTFFLPINALAQIDKATLNKAIDRAGLQRMLTQRMLKSYCQLGQDQFYAKPDEVLKNSVTRFEQGLVELKQFNFVKGVKKSLKHINAIWPNYKMIITAKATKENTPDLVSFNEKLLALSHKVVLALTTESGQESAKIVSISGRQRMLTQRIELYYLLRDWGFTNEAYIKTLTNSRKDFSEGLTYLNSYANNTDKIKGLLRKVKTSFTLFEHSLDEKNNAFLVHLTVGQLLKQMNEATNLYAEM